MTTAKGAQEVCDRMTERLYPIAKKEPLGKAADIKQTTLF